MAMIETFETLTARLHVENTKLRAALKAAHKARHRDQLGHLRELKKRDQATKQAIKHAWAVVRDLTPMGPAKKGKKQ